MARISFIFLFSILFIFNWQAYALTEVQKKQLSDFFKNTGITRKEVRFSDFLQRGSSLFPTWMLEDLQKKARLYPDLKLPQVSVKSIIHDQGEKDYQVQYVQNGQAVVMSVLFDGSLLVRVNGLTITEKDLQDYNQAWRAATEKESRTVRHGILSAEQYAKLKPEQKLDYMNKLRALLLALEQVQNARLHSGHSVAENFWFEFIWSEAQADSWPVPRVDSCFMGGYVSTYIEQNGRVICPPPRDVKCDPAGKTVVCNKSIYSPLRGGVERNSICVPADASATAKCNEQSVLNYYPLNIKDQKDIDAMKEDLTRDHGGFWAEITFCKNGRKDASSQKQCSDFNKRLQEIENLTCIDLIKSGQFKDLVCDNSNPPPQASTSENVVQVEQKIGTDPSKSEGAQAVDTTPSSSTPVLKTTSRHVSHSSSYYQSYGVNSQCGAMCTVLVNSFLTLKTSNSIVPVTYPTIKPIMPIQTIQ